jgi:hypothetical protein
MTATSVSTATILTCLALTVSSCGGETGPAPSTRSEWPRPIAGVHWRLQKAQGPGESTVFPSTIGGWLEATATGAVTGSDGCALSVRTSMPPKTGCACPMSREREWVHSRSRPS